MSHKCEFDAAEAVRVGNGVVQAISEHRDYTLIDAHNRARGAIKLFDRAIEVANALDNEEAARELRAMSDSLGVIRSEEHEVLTSKAKQSYSSSGGDNVMLAAEMVRNAIVSLSFEAAANMIACGQRAWKES